MNVCSPVPPSETGPGAGEAKEEENDQQDQTAEADVLRQCVSAASRARLLVRRRGLILSLVLIRARLRISGGAELRAAISTKPRVI